MKSEPSAHVAANVELSSRKKRCIKHVYKKNRNSKPIAEFNAEKCLLSKEEEEIILGFAEETANRGFPLSHWCKGN